MTIPDRVTYQPKIFYTLGETAQAKEYMCIKSCHIKLEALACVISKTFEAVASLSLCIASTPEDQATLINDHISLRGKTIIAGPNVIIKEGATGTLSCETLLLLTQDGKLSLGQETLQSWAPSLAQKLIINLPLKGAPR